MRRPNRRTVNQSATNRPTKVEVRTDSDGNIIIPDWATYRLLAVLTESKPALWNEEATPNHRIVHHGIGIVTELDELFPRTGVSGLVADNWIEEIGDLFWYLACIYTVLVEERLAAEGLAEQLEELIARVPEAPLSYNDKAMSLRTIQNEAVRLLNNVKRVHAYGEGRLSKEQAGQIMNSAYIIVDNALDFCLCDALGDVTPLEIAERNIAKLSKRYKAGFDPSEAVNRKLREEAEVFDRRKLVDRLEPQSVRAAERAAGATGGRDASV